VPFRVSQYARSTHRDRENAVLAGRFNRELIKVREQSVHLLQSQLKDQQNRFEAGTVPRFNVLQAEVALYNQIPQLLTAQNNYRISKLTLAKTIGLDFEPRRGENPPLELVGEMPYSPRTIYLPDAIELGKQRRPLLKQARVKRLEPERASTRGSRSASSNHLHYRRRRMSQFVHPLELARYFERLDRADPGEYADLGQRHDRWPGHTTARLA
jgi:hypothetical protein